MSEHANAETLAAFVVEARGYLPVVQAALLKIGASPQEEGLVTNESLDHVPAPPLTEAFRHVHSLKGTSSILGLYALSHCAGYVEEALEESLRSQILNDGPKEIIVHSLDAISRYLEGFGQERDQELNLLIEVVPAFRRLRGLPEEDDEAEIVGLLPQPESEPLDVATCEEELDDEDISSRLLDSFQAEAEQHLKVLSAKLRALYNSETDTDYLLQIRRTVHTLKGSASVTGLHTLARLAHRMEDVLDGIAEGRLALTEEVRDLLLNTGDLLEDLCQRNGDPATLRESAHQLICLLSAHLCGSIKQSDVPQKSAVVDADDKWVGPNQETTNQEASDPEGLASADYSSDDLNSVMAALSAFGSQLAAQEEIADSPQLSQTSSAGASLDALPSTTLSEPPSPADATVSVARRKGSVPTAGRPDAEDQNIRVPLNRLDAVTRIVGEFMVKRSYLERLLGEFRQEVQELDFTRLRMRRATNALDTEYAMGAFAIQNRASRQNRAADTRTGWGGAFNRMPSGRRYADFDSLEMDEYTEFHLLARDLSETEGDLRSAGERLSEMAIEFDNALTDLASVTSDMQERLMRLRMLPVSTLESKLHRTVRVTAQKRQKQVDLDVLGGATEIDKSMLEEIAGPLEHALRNAVDHGIEDTEVRLAAGKAARGRIEIRAYYEGSGVVIQIVDDGRGLDVEKIRASAIAKGYVDEASAQRLTSDQVFNLIFMPGFSTSSTVNETSGRGIGTDVLKSAVNRLKGQIQVNSVFGAGTTFTIRLPMSLSVSRVLLVEVGQELMAFPQADTEGVVRVEQEQIGLAGTTPVVRLDGQVVPLIRLNEFLEVGSASASDDRLTLLLTKVNGQRYAVAVDKLLDTREIVMKSLGDFLDAMPFFSGATLLGDGGVVLILNPAEIVLATHDPQRAAPLTSRAPEQLSYKPPQILIVDDSVSVRRVLEATVADGGFACATAKDGVEALEYLSRCETLPDAIMTDVEMPRMDGFELASALRSSSQYRQIPVVILTSRSGEKHRLKAKSIGVSEYLVKPFREETLLAALTRLTQKQPALV
jgi:chemosensory pili system protein ChpA (sensor histidine kinase/response regulator)